MSFLKSAKYLTWQWALEELLEIRTQTIETLDSMMVPEDYLEKGNILLNNTNRKYQNFSMGKFCKVDYELALLVDGRNSMDNAREDITQNITV